MKADLLNSLRQRVDTVQGLARMQKDPKLIKIVEHINEGFAFQDTLKKIQNHKYFDSKYNIDEKISKLSEKEGKSIHEIEGGQRLREIKAARKKASKMLFKYI